jgi:small conductance mechanosensitive channel
MRLRGTLIRGGFAVNVSILLARVVWLAVWIVGFLLVLYQFGIGLTPLAALIGVLGLAASLSLQTLLQNLVAGVYLLAERPFLIGDFIAVVGPGGVNHEGRVEDIQMRTTHLRNRDNELILMPNSAVFSGVVTNRTAVGGCVRHLKVTFPREVDVEAARSAIVPLLQGLPAVLPAPAPHLRVESVEAGTWTGALSLWGRTLDVDSDAIWAIGQAFPDASVSEEVTPT